MICYLQNIALRAWIRKFMLAAILSMVATPVFAKIIHIKVKDMAFSPKKIFAHVGDILKWDNGDFVVHTATTEDQVWNITLPAHDSGQVVLNKAGHINYYCRYHPAMTGEITVKE